MKDIISTDFDGVYLIKKKIFKDNRGFFFELFNKKKFSKYFKTNFVQDNISFSKKGTLRGLHFQLQNKQAKLITVIRGSIFDVVVDLKKKNKKTWLGFNLDENSPYSLLVPSNYAHGFLAKKNSIIHYKVSSYYMPSSEISILWNDKNLAIEWPLSNLKPIISIKDKKGISFDKI